MRLAPEVEKRKRAREVAVFETNAADLRRRGATLLCTDPFVDLLIVPTPPLRLVLPVALPGISQFQLNVPNFAARAFVLRIDLAGYDQQPPSVTFHDARSMALLPFAEIPALQERPDGGEARSIVVEAHQGTRLPFLCLPGVREYHSHPQHSGNTWALYRDAINPYAILDRVLKVLDASRPGIVISAQPCAVWDEVGRR
jgi:hypothetical protein